MKHARCRYGTMNRLAALFRVQCPIIGMVHVEALPGTPLYRNNFPELVEKAVKELRVYKSSGIVRMILNFVKLY